MENDSLRQQAQNPAPPPQTGSIIDFTPVPTERSRHDGWTPARQRQFIAALAAMGSVGKAVKAVGMGRVTAYALRRRAGAESFAAAWDAALHEGRMQQYTYAMERAINGYTVIRVTRGGVVEVQAQPDVELIRAVAYDRSR